MQRNRAKQGYILCNSVIFPHFHFIRVYNPKRCNFLGMLSRFDAIFLFFPSPIFLFSSAPKSFSPSGHPPNTSILHNIHLWRERKWFKKSKYKYFEFHKSFCAKLCFSVVSDYGLTYEFTDRRTDIVQWSLETSGLFKNYEWIR